MITINPIKVSYKLPISKVEIERFDRHFDYNDLLAYFQSLQVQMAARTTMTTALLGQILENAATVRLICRKTVVNRAVNAVIF